MTALVLGLDQGTSSTRCVALDADLRELGAFSVPVASSFPGPGLVEQDPEAIADSAQRAIAGALAAAGAGVRDVAAAGIANQTETFVVWDRATGRAIHPAIVWQDRRTDEPCSDLRGDGGEESVRERTGLALDATFPATKVAWVLDHVAGAREAAEDGRLAYGDVASWLLHRLAGVHVTDAGNAGRSLLCALGGVDWDDGLLELFGIPRALMPQVVDSDGIDVVTESGVPIRAAAGDQQASLFGLRCWKPGAAKVTLGTGAFVLAHAGDAPPRPPAGILASCAWRRAATTSYGLEGFIPTAGAAIDWFTRIGALPAGADLDALLATAPHHGQGVVCVPALQGFGSPSWDAGARGVVLGLHLGTTRAELAWAVVDGILHQVADAMDAMGEAVAFDALWVDGGLSRSDRIMQRLADLSGVRVQRTVRAESTALGAATLAGLAAGVWDGPDALPEIALDLVAESNLGASKRARERERWAEARELSVQWR
jgi:glycerol kinase